jgi:mono/diheme cytochrome c family protein
MLLGLIVATNIVTLAGAAEVDPDALRPGLITHYSARGGSFHQLEPLPAVNLAKDESPHPRVTADRGDYQWDGYLNVVRAGVYQFDAVIRGSVQVTIAGKECFNAESMDDGPRSVAGAAVKLDAGFQPLSIRFTRMPGVGRLELFWRGPGFAREPLPADVLLHLPTSRPERFAWALEYDRGRFLVEEHGCVNCHAPTAEKPFGSMLTNRKGPDLSKVGSRAYASWLDRWLADPKKLRPNTTMPSLFDDSELGRAERYAAVRYLASLGGPLKPSMDDFKPRSVDAGKALFDSIGCAVCHTAQNPAPAAMHGRWNYPLDPLGSKTTVKSLTNYLLNPLAVDPSGRMPDMKLNPKEAEIIARYLCQSTDIPPGDPTAPADEVKWKVSGKYSQIGINPLYNMPPGQQWQELGKRVVTAKGCANCHTIAPDVVPPRSKGPKALAELRLFETSKACFEPVPGKFPDYRLTADDAKAIHRFLRDTSPPIDHSSPRYAARMALTRFNCLACHQRDGEGGLSAEMAEQMRKYERAENAEAVTPPPLTGVGHKLLTPWLTQVLTQGGRARPWMALRMPQFGAANVGHLAHGFAQLEGADPMTEVAKPTMPATAYEAGRTLLGKTGMGCVSCHDYAGIPSGGTRGPDLTSMANRVRFDWYRRWLEQPQRMQPGTRMPQVFPDGKSMMPALLHGNPDDQANAMWVYAAIGASAPLPEGLGTPTKGLPLLVGDKAIIVRTFMPEAGSRAIAVGYPGGISMAFDSATCRLAFAWSGNFLDVSPVWNNRGGAPANLLGQRFWTSSKGFPWGIGEKPPDFQAQAADPALGAVPYDRWYAGPARLHFQGYSIDSPGWPTFRYVFEDRDGRRLKISERPAPLRRGIMMGVRRGFTLEGDAGPMAWLLAATSAREPRLIDGAGAGTVKESDARFVVVPLDGDRVSILALADPRSSARWRIAKTSAWNVMLQVETKPAPVEVAIDAWVMPREDQAMLKLLLER